MHIKNLFIFTSVFLGVVLCYGCKQGNDTTNQSYKTEFAATNSSNNVIITGSDGLKHIAVFSKCENYDNKLSTFASEVRFISLDIDPPINELMTFDVQLTDDFVFLSSIYHIYQYDRKGHFIQKIGDRGEGPAEYITLAPPLQIDYNEQSIYALDINRRRVIVYNFDGTFNRAFRTEFQGNIAIIDSTTIAFRQSIEERFQAKAPFVIFTDRNGKNEKIYYSHLYPVISRNEAEIFGPESSLLWEYAGQSYYLEYGADTIFRISRNSLDPIWILTGELKLDKKELFLRERGKKLANFSYVVRSNAGIFESNQFLIFKLSDSQENFYMIYDKVSGEFHRTYDKDASIRERTSPSGRVQTLSKKMDFFIDDLISGIHFNPNYQSMGKAIALIPATTVAENRNEILQHIASHPSEESARLKPIIEQMDEEDNPLVMIVTFK